MNFNKYILVSLYPTSFNKMYKIINAQNILKIMSSSLKYYGLYMFNPWKEIWTYNSKMTEVYNTINFTKNLYPLIGLITLP